MTARPRKHIHAPDHRAVGWTLCGLFRADVETTHDWSRVTCGHCKKHEPRPATSSR